MLFQTLKKFSGNIYYAAAALIILVAVLLYLLFVATAVAGSRKEVVTCLTFKTQKEAQERFASSPRTYRHLDRNRDGKACTNLPH